MEAGPREGWYEDPKDPTRLRWWDGASWTEHTRERPEPASDADRKAAELLAMPLPSATADSDDPTRRLIPWLIGGVVLLLALGVTAIVIGGEDGDGDTPPVTTTPPLNPQAESEDERAQTLVKAAQTAIETYATDHGGSYEEATAEELARIEPTLAGAEITVEPAADNYAVSVASASGNTFTITRDSAGQVSLTCGQPAFGGCPANGFWG